MALVSWCSEGLRRVTSLDTCPAPQAYWVKEKPTSARWASTAEKINLGEKIEVFSNEGPSPLRIQALIQGHPKWAVNVENL